MRKVNLLFFNPHTQERQEMPVYSLQQMREKLEEIADKFKDKEHFVGVALLDEEGNELDIGFVYEELLLVVSRGSEVEEQYCSLGDISREGMVPIYWEQWTPMKETWLIPKYEAWKAILRWVEVGDLSDAIIWTDETY